MNKLGTAAGLGILGACIAGTVYYRRTIRIPLEEYTRYALYMAVMDDEICRNELEGCRIGDEVIRFPPKAETLQDRYQMFLRMNRKKSRRQLREEIAGMEERLRESRQYIGKPGEQLEVEIRRNPRKK